MNPFVPVIDSTLAILTLIGAPLSLLLLYTLLTKKKNKLTKLLASKGLLFAFLIPVIATLGSLFYSEIAGYLPCKLCWFQRILMYPQVIVLGLAWWKKDMHAWLYGVALSAVGAVIALYHYILQVTTVPLPVPCEVVGYSASCSQYFVKEFGYITIPMMATTAFVLVILFLLNYVQANRQQ